MIRREMATVLTVLAAAATVAAQAPGRLRWQAGQVLVYKVEHATQVTDVTSDARIESKTRLALTKRWQVLDVDAAGVATVQLSLQSLVWEMTKPDGEVLRFDSAAPDKSPLEMRQSIGRYLNGPLAVLRLDTLGRVLEVKESRYGPASRFEVELPFAAVLPEKGLAPGASWERPYNITLEPPQGTGEKYAAVQHCTCKSVEGNAGVVAFTTALKAPPEALPDRIPLLDKLTEGEVVFDLGAGRMHRAVLRVDQELKDYMGQGSNYHVQTSYVEQYIGDR
jgi:hypothetical protein